MVLPSGCTMCTGSGVMCREKRGTLRIGELGKTTANLYKSRRLLFVECSN